MKICCGIFDDEGIDSFFSPSTGKEIGFLKLRADLSPQRHAVFYLAKFTAEEIRHIEMLIKAKSWAGAGMIARRISQDVNRQLSEEEIKQLSPKGQRELAIESFEQPEDFCKGCSTKKMTAVNRELNPDFERKKAAQYGYCKDCFTLIETFKRKRPKS